MQYSNMVQGTFINRPNRFIAHIEIDGKTEICHVKNTGRCRELLLEGAKVWCQKFDDPKRKTKYDLITVQKGQRLINIDSQAPNKAAMEWLKAGGLGQLQKLRSECQWGESRFDFFFEKSGKPCYLEVKGVTLENDGVCAFPDAPTQRGVKHLKELTALAEKGYGAYILFVIQMPNVKYMHPNDTTDPAFGQALRLAAAAGVKILAVCCQIFPDSMTIPHEVDIKL